MNRRGKDRGTKGMGEEKREKGEKEEKGRREEKCEKGETEVEETKVTERWETGGNGMGKDGKGKGSYREG